MDESRYKPNVFISEESSKLVFRTCLDSGASKRIDVARGSGGIVMLPNFRRAPATSFLIQPRICGNMVFDSRCEAKIGKAAREVISNEDIRATYVAMDNWRTVRMQVFDPFDDLKKLSKDKV